MSVPSTLLMGHGTVFKERGHPRLNNLILVKDKNKNFYYSDRLLSNCFWYKENTTFVVVTGNFHAYFIYRSNERFWSRPKIGHRPDEVIKIHMCAIKRSQLIFVCNLVKNQRILMQFSLLDVYVKGACGSINFIHLWRNLLLHNTLWKSKHRKCNITARY